MKHPTGEGNAEMYQHGSSGQFRSVDHRRPSNQAVINELLSFRVHPSGKRISQRVIRLQDR
jgi:hypothetical protein